MKHEHGKKPSQEGRQNGPVDAHTYDTFSALSDRSKQYTHTQTHTYIHTHTCTHTYRPMDKPINISMCLPFCLISCHLISRLSLVGVSGDPRAAFVRRQRSNGDCGEGCDCRARTPTDGHRKESLTTNMRWMAVDALGIVPGRRSAGLDGVVAGDTRDVERQVRDLGESFLCLLLACSIVPYGYVSHGQLTSLNSTSLASNESRKPARPLGALGIIDETGRVLLVPSCSPWPSCCCWPDSVLLPLISPVSPAEARSEKTLSVARLPRSWTDVSLTTVSTKFCRRSFFFSLAQSEAYL
mmetsp:Transcript_4532/g.10517  ORF Transcript_4532/g.10517 Transcript_4532/m.10517 type:complete len:297 (+) Transcript_4532:143-1033(+)